MPLYAGMTVNERLVISGLIHDWDRAVARGDRTKMIKALMATELTAEQAAEATDTTLASAGSHNVALTAGLDLDPPVDRGLRALTHRTVERRVLPLRRS
jgi:hypothetical protein